MGKTNKPLLRFRGFTDTWEQYKLDDVCLYIVAGGDIDKELIKEEGQYPVIANALTNNGIVGYYDSYYRIEAPALTVTGRGDVGHAQARKVNFTPVVRLLTAKTHHDADFLENAINLKGFVVESTGVPQLTVPKLKGLELLFPKDKTEELLIGKFFIDLDNLITLHQRKYDILTNVKQSLLDKMFPKNDEVIPKLRFKGFNNAWEQRDVKSICSISTGKSNTQDRTDEGVYPFYVRSPIIERSNRYLYDEEAVLTVGDGVGTGKVHHYISGKYDLHQRVYRMFDFVEGVSAKYFYYYFSNHFYQRVMSMTAKSSVDSVRLEMISDMKIEMPSFDEQVHIVDALDHLNNLITLHQRKHDQLIKIKKALLQKMFV